MTGSASWTLLDATADEARAFASLAAVLARPWTLAAPRNSRRHVRTLDLAGTTYYLKVFESTQLKNVVWLRCSAPRAGDEAHREAAMAGALQRAGISAPRAVAIGRDGAASYLLLADLGGQSLHDAWREHADVELLLAAARFAGEAVARGHRLPDLAADHVFVLRRAPPQFGLLDLHNASLGRPNARTLRRALRHGAASLRELGVARRAALRAGARFLRPIMARTARRRWLARQPVWDTHSRYGAPGKSRAYATRNPTRHVRELALLERVWPGQRDETVLDSPCGAGRLWPWLRARGHHVFGADRARAMLQEARGAGHCACADAQVLPLADRATHGAVMFRFLHHLDEAAAQRAIVELSRVADRWLVVSVFHPIAVHGWLRRLRGALFGRTRTRFSLSPHKVRLWLRDAGFVAFASARDGALRELTVLSFRRVDAGSR